jgi:hypothetical protein
MTPGVVSRNMGCIRAGTMQHAVHMAELWPMLCQSAIRRSDLIQFCFLEIQPRPSASVALQLRHVGTVCNISLRRWCILLFPGCHVRVNIDDCFLWCGGSLPRVENLGAQDTCIILGEELFRRRRKPTFSVVVFWQGSRQVVQGQGCLGQRLQ